ncbi:hypothetical protein GCM10009872_15660 [Actinopolymorpha rutila]
MDRHGSSDLGSHVAGSATDAWPDSRLHYESDPDEVADKTILGEAGFDRAEGGDFADVYHLAHLFGETTDHLTTHAVSHNGPKLRSRHDHHGGAKPLMLLQESPQPGT